MSPRSFSDGFADQHEVWNDSDEERVVLLLDVLRPLSTPAQLLNRALIAAVARSPYVTDGEKNQRDWEGRFERFLALRTRA